jgi:sugar phosphate isomerase/epimerase
LGKPPFNTLEGLADWAAGLGYKALQIPCNHPAIFDVEQAAQSQSYCDDVRGVLAERGLAISELSTHLEGQLIAVHPAYDAAFDSFAPASRRGNPSARQAWATEKLFRRRVLRETSGYARMRPFPARWPGLISTRGLPITPCCLKRHLLNCPPLAPVLDSFDEQGVDLCYEIHPGEDLHDGVTFERFLDGVDNHPRCNILYDPSHLHLQQLDYLAFIDIYHERIKAFHVKDAEYRKTGRSGVMAAIRAGSTGRDVFARRGTGKSILARCSANSPSTGMTAGPCWSGSAA